MLAVLRRLHKADLWRVRGSSRGFREVWGSGVWRCIMYLGNLKARVQGAWQVAGDEVPKGVWGSLRRVWWRLPSAQRISLVSQKAVRTAHGWEVETGSEEIVAVVREKYGRSDSMKTELKNAAVRVNSISKKNQYRNKGSQILMLSVTQLGRQ